EWLTKLTAYQEDILFLSPDIETYQTAILQKMGGRAVIPDGPFGIANASHLAWAGMHKQAESVHHLTPSYLRLAEAEAKWIKKQKERQENGRANNKKYGNKRLGPSDGLGNSNIFNTIDTRYPLSGNHT